MSKKPKMANASGEGKVDTAKLGREYLNFARDALARAETLLEEDGESRLVYAALELRRALEALVYENALRFLGDLGSEDRSLWQPAQLLERLIEIDPIADGALEMQMQDPAKGEWISLGRQKRLSLSALRKRYHALGNHLHAPSIAQSLGSRRRKASSLEKLCRDCCKLISEDLNATLRIGRMELFGSVVIECRECGTSIRRLLNALKSPRNNAPGTSDLIIAKCPKCIASYEVRSDGDEGLLWKEQRWVGNCPYPACDGKHIKWAREVKDGMVSKCPACGKRAVFTQTFAFLPEQLLKDLRS